MSLGSLEYACIPRRTVLPRRPCGRTERQKRESRGTSFRFLATSVSVRPPWTAREHRPTLRSHGQPLSGQGQSRPNRRRKGWGVACTLLLLLPIARGDEVTVSTPLGPVRLDLSHVGPSGDIVTPSAPQAAAFAPPTIFSAPLPSGSGARALGLGGAFTAVADDATAASWNPAGLIQLQTPEASVVARGTRIINRHHSTDDDFEVGTDRFDSMGVNYLSLVYPFPLLGRNWVFSANYQEAYDFEQRFSADMSPHTSSVQSRSEAQTSRETSVMDISNNRGRIQFTSDTTTRIQSSLAQTLKSELVSSVDFEQEGILDAVSPVLAVEVTPRVWCGAALNVYRDGLLGRQSIRSRTLAHYSGTSESVSRTVTERETSGAYAFEGEVWVPPFGGQPGYFKPIDRTEGTFPTLSDTSVASRRDVVKFDGVYEEHNEYDSLDGLNTTLGLLWTLSRQLSLGLTVDTPWTADATQTRQIRNTVTTYDASRTRLLDVTSSLETDTGDIEIHFPLYCAVGAVWRWNNQFYTSLDVSRTQWSDFWYRRAGEGKTNPLDGTAYGVNELDDCWSVRAGCEFLKINAWTAIPFRAGVGWEQRPAIDAPDNYWQFSAGTGISLGKGPRSLILDVAYIHTRGDGVSGSRIPGQDSFDSDVRRHDVYISSIVHF